MLLKTKDRVLAAAVIATASFGVCGAVALAQDDAAKTEPAKVACAADPEITVPQGFCATIFADSVGAARHLTVAEDGTVYVNISNRHSKIPGSGAYLALKDSDGDGRADLNESFGEATGGTGIAVYKDWLYAESGDRILRYPRKQGDFALRTEPEIVLKDLPMKGDHRVRSFAIDPEGRMFVNIGSATNSCQEDNRTEGSPGINPCEELKRHAGVWLYDANKTEQVFSEDDRFATGIRNAEGIDFDSKGRIFATQHGRDQLFQNWPKLYTSEQGSELPAEVLVELQKGGDYGWPYCYFDGEQGKLVLAPEYGGDGGKKVGDCGEKQTATAAFPAHWGPNDMKIYKGAQFPASYRDGAFIAFHGSWNRSSGPQEGFNVVFQPLADGKASGPYQVFADGFRKGGHRPAGVAVGPDGALYVSDDAAGRIWRITYGN
ncbi:hypothetical protein DLM45_04515 [Hyphomicrobium methylovorum]|uniref:PQQ-dependent sugar dehydrogenase n=1 Tax=Hyphomicrobium methylovorum TaxID=84 RepID=UPI0015E6961E|nr:PQQ-dependent sugar dehydrogenase [Hyphomicrobium methylovorum]MBA2125488.1 hypothetical protein [Hyphomicrobium methylovorum]